MENDIQKISLEVESKSSDVGNGIQKLTSQLQTLDTAVKPATRDLKSLSSAMDSLKTSSQGINKINFQGVTTNLTSFANSLNRINSSIKGFSSMGAQMRDMSSGLNSMRRSFESLGSVAPDLNKIKLNGISGEIGKLTSLAKLSDDFVKTKDGAKAFSSGINSLTKSVNKLPDLIQKINSLDLKDFKNQTRELADSLKILTQSIEGVNVASKNMGNSIGKMPTIVGKMNKSLSRKSPASNGFFFSNSTNTLSTFYMFKELARIMGYPIRKANDFIETMNLFNVVMGESNKRAAEFITSLESIGVDWEQAMRYQSSFYDIGKSLGMVSKNAYTVSEQFTKLSYDYASLYNLPVEESFQKLQAALVGTVEPIRRLGKDISIAKLQEVALNLGIQESVRNMNQAERAELRFIAVMQQSASAMNDMERTINQPANALRVLKAQMTSLAREIGSLFIPILTSVLPYLIAMVKLIREITQSIMALFGIKLFELDFKQVSQPLGIADAYTDNMADNLNKGAKAAKKIKDYMIGIDELNVLNKDTGNVGRDTGAAGIGSPVGGGGLGLDLEKYGYEEVLKKVQSRADKIYQTFRKWKTPLMVSAGILGGIWAVGKVMKFINALKGVGKASTFVMGMRGIGGVAKSLAKLGAKGGILASTTKLFVSLGDIVLLTGGIMSSSAVLSGVVGLTAVLVPLGLAIAGIHHALKPAVEKMDVFKNITEKTKEKLEPFVETWESLDKNLTKLDWSNKIITDKDIQKIQGKVHSMVESVLDEVDSDRNENLKHIDMLKDAHVISDETYQARIQEVTGYYGDIEKSTQDAEARINEIMTTASQEKRDLTSGEVEEIRQLQNQIRDNGIQTMSESEREQTLILTRLKHNATALTVETASEMLKSAQKNRDNQLKEAEQTRTEMLNELDLRFGDEANMSNEAYAEQVKEIENWYAQETDSAKTGYANIVEQVRLGLGDMGVYVDEGTGEIKSKWSVFWGELDSKATEKQDKVKKALKEFFSKCDTETSKGVKKLKDLMDFDWHLPNLKMPHFSVSGKFDFKKKPPKVPKLNVKWYAHGGYVPERASYVSPDNIWTAGEAGREIIGNHNGKTTVMPLEDTGFVQAMYRAVKDGVKEAMNQTPITIPVTSTLTLDGKEIHENQKNYQYTIGTSMVKMV